MLCSRRGQATPSRHVRETVKTTYDKYAGNGFGAEIGALAASTTNSFDRLAAQCRDAGCTLKAAPEWDLVIGDEAHRMSASFFGQEVRFTKRYQLGALAGELTRHLLLMTATPHNGKEEDFQLFMGLLDADRFEGRFREGVRKVDPSDMMRRLTKEELRRFDGSALFERRAYTIAYSLSPRVCFDHRHVGKVGAWSEGTMVLPNIGQVKLRGRALPATMPKMVTVSRDTAGRYWASLAVEEEVKAAPEPVRYSVGIDAGARYLATLSCGERIENPRSLRRHAARLAKEQQRLARQKKGSNRREETRKKIARIHARIADCRRENMHRATTRTVHENQVLCVESLGVKEITASARGTKVCPGTGVTKRTRINRALLDAAMGEMLRQIKYKSDWYGRRCIEIAPDFPSSGLCSSCGVLNPHLTIDDIRWTCETCGTAHDRDENAAVNIQVEGLTHLIHPEDTGGVRASGGEGRYPHHADTAAVAVPARIGRATQALSGTA